MKERAFQLINNQNTAYWLGFLAADGSCSRGRKNRLEIGLARRDRDHLEKFLRFLDLPESMIVDYNSLCSNNGKYYPSSKIDIYNNILLDDLERYNIVPSKSYINIDFLEAIPEEYKWAFIFGYFDGDGWFSNTEKTINFGFCGNEKTMNSINLYLFDYFNEKAVSVLLDKKTTSTYHFSATAKQKVLKFVNLYISYESKCDLLTRKLNCAKDIKNKLDFYFDTKVSFEEKRLYYKTMTMYNRTCQQCNKNFVTSHSEQKYCSYECAQISSRIVKDRPNREELKKLIRHTPFLQIGKLYNVSDNAIRKWCKAVHLPSKVSEIKQYSDEEWEKI